MLVHHLPQGRPGQWDAGRLTAWHHHLGL